MHAEAAGGVQVQFSPDNSTWTTIGYKDTLGAGKSISVDVPVCKRYARVVYTNSGTNQASFSLSLVPVLPPT